MAVALANCPSGHGTYDAWPAAGCTYPTGTLTHDVCCCCGWYVPGRHDVYVVAPPVPFT